MKKHLALLALAALTCTGAWADTAYTFQGPNYTGITNYTPPCSAGSSCADFMAVMTQSGSFTTATPLPPNLNLAHIENQVTSWSFNDGLVFYDNNNASLFSAQVSTDANGNITAESIHFLRWLTASHNVGDRVSYLAVNVGSFYNVICTQVDVAGNCIATNNDAASSEAFAHADSSTAWITSTINVPAAPPQSVPVDNPFALALTAAAVLGLALRRRKQGQA